jgi:Ribbon-helix-helix protein, copG family
MRRTNIYLDDRQLELLRGLSDARGRSVAELVREAVDSWLESQRARRVPPGEWEERFDALLDRRARLVRERQFDPAQVERDVMEAVREVRRARSARRR